MADANSEEPEAPFEEWPERTLEVDATDGFEEQDFGDGDKDELYNLAPELPARKEVIREPSFRGDLQRSLLLIKPEAVHHKFKILARVKKAGFFVLKERHVLLSPEQASEFFAENYGREWFPRQVALTARGPVLALCLTKLDAIDELNRLVGPPDVAAARRTFPACLRAQFGNIRDNLRDAVKASSDADNAEFEIHFFFPRMTLEPAWSEQRLHDLFNARLRDELLCSLAEVCKVKPIDPVLWLARYLLLNDRAQPQQDERVATLKT